MMENFTCCGKLTLILKKCTRQCRFFVTHYEQTSSCCVGACASISCFAAEHTENTACSSEARSCAASFALCVRHHLSEAQFGDREVFREVFPFRFRTFQKVVQCFSDPETRAHSCSVNGVSRQVGRIGVSAIVQLHAAEQLCVNQDFQPDCTQNKTASFTFNLAIRFPLIYSHHLSTGSGSSFPLVVIYCTAPVLLVLSFHNKCTCSTTRPYRGSSLFGECDSL